MLDDDARFLVPPAERVVGTGDRAGVVEDQDVVGRVGGAAADGAEPDGSLGIGRLGVAVAGEKQEAYSRGAAALA